MYLFTRKKKWSGRKDLNLRPPGPEPGALARLRYAPTVRQNAGKRPPAETFRIAQEIRPHQRTYSATSMEFRALKHTKAPCLHKKPPERCSSPAANCVTHPVPVTKI